MNGLAWGGRLSGGNMTLGVSESALLRLLVLLLIPVLIVANPSVSQAATRTPAAFPAASGIVEATAGVSWFQAAAHPFGFQDLECNSDVSLATSTGASTISFTDLSCQTPERSIGYSQPGEEGSAYVVWVTGTDCGGKGTGTFEEGPENGVTVIHGISGGAAWTSGPATCDPANACIQITGGSDSGASVVRLCAPVDLDPGTVERGSCEKFRPATPQIQSPVPGYVAYDDATVALASGTAPWSGDVTAYVVVTPHASEYAAHPQIAPGSQYGISVRAHTVGSFPSSAWSSAQVTNGTGHNLGAARLRIVGFGLFVGNPNSQPLNALPQTNGTGLWGVTDPNKCSFYWGPKIAQIQADDTDEPYAPLGAGGGADVPPPGDEGLPPPTEEPAGCSGFSWTDPDTWGGSAMCMMVGLLYQMIDRLGWIAELLAGLGDLLRGLGDALASILDALGRLIDDVLDGLEGLFVPDTSSWGWSDLRAQWNARPPGSIVNDFGDGFSGIATGFRSSGGCGTLADFTSEDIRGTLTCGLARSAPGYAALYGLVQAGLIGLTCWGLWRIVRGVID